ncbi:GDSL-type esterase/lipase family protein [Leptolyngbyaceae cyanobacterium UHCC 1019]
MPTWAIPLSLVSGLLLPIVLLSVHRDSVRSSSQVRASTVEEPTPYSTPHVSSASSTAANGDFGVRRQLNYAEWVELLKREAIAIADQTPTHLKVLAGDSLSLWFPSNLLPAGATWLNQGISGETSYGLLKRVKFLDQTKPQTIFVMIGINDLIRGVRGETLVANQREIVRHLKAAHPQARIVIQSILPHGGDRASRRYLASVKGDPAAKEHPLWVERLPTISSRWIRTINEKLARVAQDEGVEYLDLHSDFADAQGYLKDELTTDGLHLSVAGYALWRSKLEQAGEVVAKPPISRLGTSP